MPDEPKVPAAPDATVKAAADETLIDNPRKAVEDLVIAENETVPEPITDDIEPPPAVEDKKEKVADDQLDNIKKAVQKRIDKVIAQKKSVEEELVDTKAELERLKSQRTEPKTEAPSPDKQDKDSAPTPEQVEAYILKMREEGNVKEEIAATRYLIKLEKELAIKAVKEEQETVRKQAEAKREAELKSWVSLNQDYTVYDSNGKPDNKHQLTLANQNGLLYKTALALYQDRELFKEFYADPDKIQGFRRAVADAYREIHQQNLFKTPKDEPVVESRTPRVVLADPGTESTEDVISSQPAILSDADKVREEIKQRHKLRNSRRMSA